MISADKLIKLLGLKPHPEGGYFREAYSSDEMIGKAALPKRYEWNRRNGTAIFYLLTREAFSAIRRIKTDEVYHFYLGDPVELTQLLTDGSGRVTMLGNDIAAGAHVQIVAFAAGAHVQIVVSRGTWHGAQLVEGGNYALLRTTVSPGFEFADFEIRHRTDLTRSYPSFSDSIIALTRSKGLG